MLSSVIGRSHQGRKVASYHLKKCPVGERRRQIHRLTGSTQTCNGDSFNSNHSQLRKGPYFYSLTTLGLAFAYLNAKDRNFRGSSSKMFCSLEKVIENQPEGLTQEQSVGADKVENNEQENDESWVENDWSDLPAEDEDKETSCFICLVNREGKHSPSSLARHLFILDNGIYINVCQFFVYYRAVQELLEKI